MHFIANCICGLLNLIVSPNINSWLTEIFEVICILLVAFSLEILIKTTALNN